MPTSQNESQNPSDANGVSDASSSISGPSDANGVHDASDANGASISASGASLAFDPANFTRLTLMAGDQEVNARAYENIVYVSNPTDLEHQIINIYVPEAYFEGKSVGSFDARTAPIYFPNAISLYLPAIPLKPRISKRTGVPNASLIALSKGYVVASPGVRGRSSVGEDGRYVGKAPACIIDMKAAVRYLRYNAGAIPGDMDRIIPDGFSAGGAVSALLGATGNNAEYAHYLKEVGAAEARDDVFAASCYCPVYNLGNLDIGYEWQVKGIEAYGYRDVSGTLTDEQKKVAEELGSRFPAYLNSLNLLSFDHANTAGAGVPNAACQLEAGTPLTLDGSGNGPYKDFALSFLVASAQKALNAGADLSASPWVAVDSGGIVTGFDIEGYKKTLRRMHPPPAFDNPERTSAECELFGTETINSQHYTPEGLKYGKPGGSMAGDIPMRLMNPMSYIGIQGSDMAKHWRVRHGTRDFGHLLTNPIIISTVLQNRGFDVDCALAWDQTHGGDYDLGELFEWIGKICGEKVK
jgi:hypothetical protein